jgi:hypothetical protein
MYVFVVSYYYGDTLFHSFLFLLLSLISLSVLCLVPFPNFCYGSTWFSCRWSFLLEVAIINRCLSLLILFIISVVSHVVYKKWRNCSLVLLSIDIDECMATNSLCSQTCDNTDGSYKCSCNTGFFLDRDGISCVGKYATQNNVIFPNANELDI